LQDTIDDIRNYIVEQKIQIEAKTKFLTKSKVLSDRVNQTSEENNNRTNHQLTKRNSFPKYQKENDYYFRDIDRLSSQTYENDSRHRSSNLFQLSTEQTNTIDNLVQKLEDHIASELDRFVYLN